MPPLNFPRIRRTDANLSLIGQAFVLRLGRQDRPVLSLTGDDGRPVHVPLRYDAKTDTYMVGANGLLLTKATRLRDLIDRAIPARMLEKTIDSILRGTPQPLDFEPRRSAIAASVLSYLKDAEVCKFGRGSYGNRVLAAQELRRRFRSLSAPHRPIVAGSHVDVDADVLRFFEEAESLRKMGVTLTNERPIDEQLLNGAYDCLHRVQRSSRYVGRYRTATEQVADAGFMLGLLRAETREASEALQLRAEVHAHRGRTVDVLDLLARLRARLPGKAAVFARSLACIAAEQDHGDLLRCIAMLYPRGVSCSVDAAGHTPMDAALTFGSKSAVRTLLEAGVNLDLESLRAWKRKTLDALSYQEQAQKHGSIVQTVTTFSQDRAILQRRLQALTLCFDAARQGGQNSGVPPSQP